MKWPQPSFAATVCHVWRVLRAHDTCSMVTATWRFVFNSYMMARWHLIGTVIKDPSYSLWIMAPKVQGHLAAQKRSYKPEVPTLTKSGHQREIPDTSQLLKTTELQDQRSDFNETHIALINYPCRPLQGGINLDKPSLKVGHGFCADLVDLIKNIQHLIC